MKKVIEYTIMVLCICTGLFIGFSNQKKQEARAEGVKNETQQNAGKTMESTDQKKEEYQKKIQDMLDEYGKKLDELKAKGKELSEDAKAEYNKMLQNLAEKRKVAAKKFKQLSKASEKTWENFKDGVDKAAAEMEKAFSDAISKYSK